MQIKIIPVFPNIDDATCFYRGVIPLADLSHRYPIDITYTPQMKDSIMAHADIIFMQRPFMAEHLGIMQMAEKQGKPVWIDYDDDLFCVPEDNKAYDLYNGKEMQARLAEMIAMANVVTVSTRHIAKKYDDIRKLAEKPACKVIPNAFWDRLVPKRREEVIPKRPLIFWRGSETHTDDILSVSPEIISVMRDNPNWSLHFLGYNPRWICRNLPKSQVLTHPPFSIMDYHTYLQEIQPSITIVPLVDIEFNHCKSNIAWMETSWAHSMVLAPDFEEWRMPGCFNYTNGDDFERKLRGMVEFVNMQISDPRTVNSAVNLSWEHIHSKMLLSDVNQARWEVIESLIPAGRLDSGEMGACKYPEGYREHYPVQPS